MLNPLQQKVIVRKEGFHFTVRAQARRAETSLFVVTMIQTITMDAVCDSFVRWMLLRNPSSSLTVKVLSMKEISDQDGKYVLRDLMGDGIYGLFLGVMQGQFAWNVQ